MVGLWGIGQISNSFGWCTNDVLGLVRRSIVPVSCVLSVQNTLKQSPIRPTSQTQTLLLYFDLLIRHTLDDVFVFVVLFYSRVPALDFSCVEQMDIPEDDATKMTCVKDAVEYIEKNM